MKLPRILRRKPRLPLPKPAPILDEDFNASWVAAYGLDQAVVQHIPDYN